MATEDPIVISRAWCSMFKSIKEPNTSHIINTHTKVEKLLTQVGSFNRSLLNEVNPKIITREIVQDCFSQRYLLVLGQLSKVLSTHLYTKEILEPDEIEPKQQIIITGYVPEVVFINYFANYLLEMMEGLNKNNQHLSSNGMQAKALREKEFLMPIYTLLKNKVRWVSETTKSSLKKRYQKQLHYIFNMYKFEYKNNKKPAFDETPMWNQIIITDGKWKKHKLLWGM